MRENRPCGSEGGEAKPSRPLSESMNTGPCRIRSVCVYGPRAPSLRSGPGVTIESTQLETALKPDGLPVRAPLGRREVPVLHAIDELRAAERGGPAVGQVQA